jgi:hypothetical protein
MTININKLSNNITLLVLVSLIIIVLQKGEINRDGIMYLAQSKYIIEGNWDKMISLYNWPFFSTLIAGLHKVSGLSLQYAAHLINVILFILASFFFIKSVTLVSHNKTPIFYATLILLTSIPLMDDYLSMVLRDQGQWAGFMMGVYGYLRWIKNPKWSWAILWQVGFMFGTLFRPECIMFNILLPFTHQFLVKTGRLKAFMQSISIPLVSLLMLPVLWLIFSIDVNTSDLARLNEIIDRPVHFLNNILQPLAIDTQNFYLKVLIADFAISFKYFFLTYVAVYKWVAGLGLLHLALFGYALKQRLIISPYLKVLSIFFVLSSMITIINLYTTFVIANRYWVMNFWIVYIVAAIGLSHFWSRLNKSKHPQKKWLLYFLIAALLIYFLNILIDKPEKHVEQEVGDWVKQEQLDVNNIYFNDNRTAYHSGLLAYEPVGFDYAINVIQYQYLAIRYNRFDEIKPIQNYEPIKFFPNKKKPKLIIYQSLSYD